MPRSLRPLNPFYPLLIAVSVVFAVTACAYFVMALRALAPTVTSAAAVSAADPAGRHPLTEFLDRHGMPLMLSEVGALAVVSLLAMGTDRYWTDRAARRGK